MAAAADVADEHTFHSGARESEGLFKRREHRAALKADVAGVMARSDGKTHENTSSDEMAKRPTIQHPPGSGRHRLGEDCAVTRSCRSFDGIRLTNSERIRVLSRREWGEPCSGLQRTPKMPPPVASAVVAGTLDQDIQSYALVADPKVASRPGGFFMSEDTGATQSCCVSLEPGKTQKIFLFNELWMDSGRTPLPLFRSPL
ncbi:hypothetical protein [Methylobacterium gnaphalii]|uniref:hypothetical protein n=1 Tax=Methylobacterium gnaphalii TaxID=1010610 RepID=UPI0011BE1D4D|nr:hypothetical protein [Methylobacterium gnaphalii]GLS49706.1 hypothetical protein GCM10007885_25560 [Methylobacterium gnaphalii]